MNTKSRIVANWFLGVILLAVSSFIAGCEPGKPGDLRLFLIFTPTPPLFTPTPTLTPMPVSGQIVGKVYWRETGATIQNAIVALNNSALEDEDPNYKIAETLTDENGRYVFDNLEPGEFGLMVILMPDKHEIKTSDLPTCTTSGIAFDVGKNDELLFAMSVLYKNGQVAYIVGGFGVEMPTTSIIEMDLEIFCR